MSCSRPARQILNSSGRLVLSVCFVAVAATACLAQGKPADSSSADEMQRELLGNKELLASFGRVLEKLQTGVALPEPRSQSRLLSLLPSDTVLFAAIPNYGNAAEQALRIFQQELKSDATLREWWGKGEMAFKGPKIEDALTQFCRIHQYLGDEIILSGSMAGNEPKFLAVAALRKPGLDKLLKELLEKNDAADVRVLGPQELATVKQKEGRSGLLILVRPDYVFAAEDPATLRAIDTNVTRASKEFPDTPFGTRVAKEYQGGLTLLVGANIESALRHVPRVVKQDPGIQQSGFADAKYLVWDHKRIDGRDVSQSELSFSGPRHGAAAWLAKPGPLTTLDFVSPATLFALTLKLEEPAKIFDEIRSMSKPGPGSPLAVLPQAEQALGLSVRDDLLGTLDGEVSLELDDVRPQHAAWRAVLSVKDVPRLEKTLDTLLTATQTKVDQSTEDGVAFHTVHIPSSPEPYEISYSFLDRFLVLGSSRDAVAQSAKIRRSGTAVSKSPKFLAATPPGHTREASGLWYQNPMGMVAMQIKRLAPDLAGSIETSLKDSAPAVAYVYGEESSIKSVSTNSALDLGSMLVVAAVAIPNLIKSKAAANEAGAVGSLRTIVTAQIAYASQYPKLGFAQNLTSLGPDPKGAAAESPAHAGFLDVSLAGPTCSGDIPCIKSGYQFGLTATCKEHRCDGFLAVATPVNTSTGSRSFCATEDGVIRYKIAVQLTARPTIADCKKWPELQ